MSFVLAVIFEYLNTVTILQADTLGHYHTCGFYPYLHSPTLLVSGRLNVGCYKLYLIPGRWEACWRLQCLQYFPHLVNGKCQTFVILPIAIACM